MEQRLKTVHDEGKESGVVLVHKVADSELKRIGEIKFSDASDKKWILMVMTEDHPNVSAIG